MDVKRYFPGSTVALTLVVIAIPTLFAIHYICGDWIGGIGSGIGTFLLLFSIPFSIWWFVYLVFLALGLTGRPHLAIAILFTVTGLFLAFQPWHPRIQFVEKLNSIDEGMSEADVRRIMSGYHDAYLHETSDEYLPESLWGQKVTHCLSYRWSDDGRYNADIAEIFLKDGKVVGRRFLPD